VIFASEIYNLNMRDKLHQHFNLEQQNTEGENAGFG